MQFPNHRYRSFLCAAGFVFAALSSGLVWGQTIVSGFTGPYSLGTPTGSIEFGSADTVGAIGNWTGTASGFFTDSRRYPHMQWTPNLLDIGYPGYAVFGTLGIQTYTLTTTIQTNSLISFTWRGASDSGGGGGGSYGYFLNGTFNALSERFTSGSTSVGVSQGDVFGFYLKVDYTGGAVPFSGVIIQDFSAIPEVTSTTLLCGCAVLMTVFW